MEDYDLTHLGSIRRKRWCAAAPTPLPPGVVPRRKCNDPPPSPPGPPPPTSPPIISRQTKLPDKRAECPPLPSKPQMSQAITGTSKIRPTKRKRTWTPLGMGETRRSWRAVERKRGGTFPSHQGTPPPPHHIHPDTPLRLACHPYAKLHHPLLPPSIPVDGPITATRLQPCPGTPPDQQHPDPNDANRGLSTRGKATNLARPSMDGKDPARRDNNAFMDSAPPKTRD